MFRLWRVVILREYHYTKKYTVLHRLLSMVE